MLDDIKKLALEVLSLTSAEVDEAQDELLAELASADARAAANDAKWHPRGSTTRLEDAVPRAQKTYDRQRDALLKAAPKFIGLLIAAEVARVRREEAEKFLRLKWKADSAGGSNGLPKEVVEWYPRLERHGVKRSYLGETSDEVTAVLADLIRWKAKDARFRDADNPWRAILGIYAERVIVRPDRRFTATLSTPGTPTMPRHVSSDRHYMFNDMLAELPPPRREAVAVPPPKAMFDCSIMPTEEQNASPHPAEITPAAEDVTASASDEQFLVTAPGKHEPADAGADAPSTTSSQVEPVEAISLQRATVMATVVFDTDAHRMGIYWPPAGVDRNDFDSGLLIPALEAWVASGAWTGAVDFLKAALDGRARQFIDEERARGIQWLARGLVEGEMAARSAAKKAGFDV